MSRMIEKEKPGIPIAVDGEGFVEDSLMLVAAGAERLISGSAFFGAPDKAEFVRQMKALGW